MTLSLPSHLPVGGEWLPLSWDRLLLCHTEVKDSSCWEIAYPVVSCSCFSPCVKFFAWSLKCPKQPSGSVFQIYGKKMIPWTTERKERAPQQNPPHIYPIQLNRRWNMIVVVIRFTQTWGFLYECCISSLSYFTGDTDLKMALCFKEGLNLQICWLQCNERTLYYHSLFNSSLSRWQNPVCQQEHEGQTCRIWL